MKFDYPLKIGILGGGQLAKMLAQVAQRMGMNVAIIENHPNSPAGEITKLDFYRGWNNKDELDKFIDSCDVVTLENEFIDPKILEYIEQRKPVFPNSKTMRLVQDKFIQKKTFQNAGIPVPDFQLINSIDDIHQFAHKHGFPIVLKSRFMGYDGYGNATIRNEIEIELAYNKFRSQPNRNLLYVEKFVNFQQELAIMIARNHSGETAIYPLVQTIQRNHICNEVIAPANVPPEINDKARTIAQKCVESIDGIGIFGIEFFYENGNILVNEIAPRPHNTGHYTIEACYTSQFENAIRAILDLPLGNPEMIVPAAVMLNLLGERNGNGSPTDISGVLKTPNTFLHLYNKKESRIGRKMGHITVLGNDIDETYSRALYAKNLFKW